MNKDDEKGERPSKFEAVVEDFKFLDEKEMIESEEE